MKKNWLLIAGIVVFAIGCSKGAEDTSAATSTTGTTPPATTGSSTTGSAASASTTGFAGVQAILTKNCAGCHGSSEPKGGINLTSYDTVMKGGNDGAIVTAGDPTKSKIIDALRARNGAMQMPKGSAPLAEADIKTIEDWITAGAKA